MSTLYILKLFLILFSCSFVVIFSCSGDGNGNKARYDNYRLIRVKLESEEHVKLFQELEQQSDSYTFYGHALNPGQDLTLTIAAHKISEIEDLAQRFNIQVTILENNIQRLIDEESKTIKPKSTPALEFGWDNYYHLATIYKWMSLQIDRHDFVTGFVLGYSYMGVPIQGIKISRKSGNTGIFVEAGIHAREWISPATATFIIDNLINSRDPAVLSLSNDFDWYFVPILNVDGYKYTFDMDRLWRKNLKPYGRCLGVDLNRNFDSNWNGTGSSADPCRYDFCGSSAFSEPEAGVIKTFLDAHAKEYNIQTYLSLHSFSQLYMFPYGHTAEKVKNYDDLMKMGSAAVEAIRNTHGRIYKSGSSMETIYPSSGGSMDFVYSQYNVPIAFTIELRGPPETPNLFILPANEIRETGEETLAAFIAMLQEARNLGYFRKEEKEL